MYKYQNISIGELIPSIYNRKYPYSICVDSAKTTAYNIPRAPNVLYHYTSTNAFENIVSSKSFFLSLLSNTNDRREMIWLLELVEKEIKQRIDNRFLEIVLETLRRFSYKPYYASFSELKDDLNQWVKYGDRGQGVSIGFSSKKIPFSRKLPLIGMLFDASEAASLLKIDYAEKRMRKEINNILDNVVKNRISPSDAAFCISKMSFTCKHYDWASEKEWRIVCVPIACGNENFLDLKLGQERKISSPEEIVTTCGEKKEICKMNFQPTDIAEVIIGPKNHITKQGMESFLKTQGYDVDNITKVYYSNSSLR